MEVLFLLSALNGADVETLRADVWERREDAQARLRSRGLLAVPELLRGARESESPEVRQRCNELLVPYYRMCAKLRAVAVLTGPRLPNESAFWHDAKLRENVFRLARQAGCAEYATEGFPLAFPPDHELTPADALELLTEYRKQLGYHREPWELVGEAIASSARAQR